MTNSVSRADIMAWRKAERRRLIEERLAVDPGERRRRATEVAAALSRFIDEPAGRTVSAYWPFRGEPDLRPWMNSFAERGGSCALPVVIAKNAPLVFRAWKSGDKLVSGAWNIPVPADGGEVIPDIVIAPVVGYDKNCYRLRPHTGRLVAASDHYRGRLHAGGHYEHSPSAPRYPDDCHCHRTRNHCSGRASHQGHN